MPRDLIKNPITSSGAKDLLANKKSQQTQQPTSFLGKANNVVQNIGNTGGKVLGSLIKSEQKFGEDIGKSVYLSIFGGQKKIDKISQQYLDSGKQMIPLIKKEKDPIRKQKLADLAIDSFKKAGMTTENIMGELKTNKQILGDAAGVLLDVLSVGVYGKAATEVTKGVGAISGMLQGAKTGAISGAVLGGAYGTTGAMQENKSLGSIAGSGALGAVGGGITGGILGGTIGAISGGIKGKVIKESNYIKDLVSPKQTPKVKELAFKQGRVTEPGLLKKSEILASKRDIKIAESVKDIVSSKKTVIQNADAIDNKIQEISSGVEKYITGSKRPFNENQLRKQLDSGKNELDLIFASEANAEKTYNAVRDKFIEYVKSKDTLGLFKARQNFDQIPAIKKLLESEGLGENVKKEIVLNVRKAANEYIAKLLPSGNQYRELLLRESKMFEALGNIAEKNAATIGKNKIQLLTEKYPILKAIFGGLAAGLGLGAVGVGSSIIGSSDR